MITCRDGEYSAERQEDSHANSYASSPALASQSGIINTVCGHFSVSFTIARSHHACSCLLWICDCTIQKAGDWGNKKAPNGVNWGLNGAKRGMKKRASIAQ
jgi:hypothetical protein